MTDAQDELQRRASHSHRRMTPARKLAYRLAAPLIGGFCRLYWRSCRIEDVMGEQDAEPVLAAGKPVIPCYWHRQQLFCVPYLIGLRRRGIKLGFLISLSPDGELIARIVEKWGANCIRGSATRTGAHTLRALYQAITREGISPVTTPDGPRGPVFQFKSGTVMLAQISGAPMLPIAYAAKKSWQLKSWDRLIIPRPFTRIVVAVGRPRYVERGLAAGALEPIRLEMEQALNELWAQARAALDGKRQ